MWIEDKDQKIIREAKREAYGKCPLHKDHFDGYSYFKGIMTVVVAAALCLVAYAIGSAIIRDRVREKTVYSSSTTSSWPNMDGSLTITQCDADGNCHSNNGSAQ